MDLDATVTNIPLVGAAYQKKLEKLNISTIRDLLFHIPSRYEDFRQVSKIKDLLYGDVTTIQGELESFQNNYTKRGKNFQSAVVSGSTGSVQVIWFNQPYIANNLKKGDKISISGKLGSFGNKLSFVSPSYEVMRGNKTVHTAKLVPVYPETAGVSSKWLRSRINHVLDNLQTEEYLPKKFLNRYDLIPISKAFRQIHRPEDMSEVSSARQRLAFDELLDMQIQTAERKFSWSENTPTHRLKVKDEWKKEFSELLPFDLTASQKRSIKEILADLKADKPMNRLLEGDVGSGKTAVAAAGAFISYMNGYQTVLMAPTQILAEQHFRSLKELFKDSGTRVELIVSGSNKTDNDADIFVGTHALIHDRVDFKKVAFVVIDEQHRFGVEQRKHLIVKSKNGNRAPHSLTMTATPIPRTVALTFYGDLDLSTLDELPAGRRPVTTWVVPPKKREGAYEWIRQKIKDDDIQIFVICPLIEESEHKSMQQIRSATAEFEYLKDIFSELNVGLLHGKQKNEQKSNILDDFKKHKIDILVSTPVVEVGIDVPNATIMMIEGADRFGLAQLHQLRGRVGRGHKKSYCLLFTESKSTKTIKRLDALSKLHSGFELAELDLQMRGPGEILGVKQHGFLELKAANWQDKELIKATKKTAEEMIRNTEKYADFFEKRYSKHKILN